MKDLLMGARLTFAGGRDGLTRTTMTALGVALGVALLLLAVAVPAAFASRDARIDSYSAGFSVQDTKGQNTLLYARADSVFHGQNIRGALIEAEGAAAPLPPGLTRWPAAGEMFVSPALQRLLDSPDGELLRPRFPFRITGIVGDAGLSGPFENAWYAGGNGLDPTSDAIRIAGYGGTGPGEGLDPTLLLLVAVIVVVLLLPVGVFIAAAVRFGSEQRDRRLAALRLVGADRAMTRRIAVGEALTASAFGVLLGGLLFLLGRQIAPLVSLQELSVFAGDLRPPWPAVLLVVVVVPALAFVVTVLALRGVLIEPLGVARRSRPGRGRLWWRLAVPVAGLALLVPSFVATSFDRYQVAGGVVLLLTGVAALLPWLVEAVTGRIRGGPVPWQLAVRRLQMNAGSAGRVVNGIAVAVAGAIALQMLFAGLEPVYTRDTGVDLQYADVTVLARPRDADALERAVAAVPGISGLVAVRSSDQTLIAGCATLAQLATLPSCRPGSTFVTPGYEGSVPAGAVRIVAATNGEGRPFEGILSTPEAVRAEDLKLASTFIHARSDGRTDTMERVRNAVGAINPSTAVFRLAAEEVSDRFVNIRRGLFVGAVVTLLLIGLSLLVGTLEQLRDRRRLLAVLAAFGTRRGTLGWSVLWQTTLPVALGLLLAVPAGLGTGALLLLMVGRPLTVNTSAVAWMSLASAVVVLLVTVASLPVPHRIMRAEGLRME